MRAAVPQGPGTYRLSIIDGTTLIDFKALCAHLCPADLRAAAAFSCAPAWGGGYSVYFLITFRDIRTNPVSCLTRHSSERCQFGILYVR